MKEILEVIVILFFIIGVFTIAGIVIEYLVNKFSK
jgi:hypothetical protein